MEIVVVMMIVVVVVAVIIMVIGLVAMTMVMTTNYNDSGGCLGLFMCPPLSSLELCFMIA